MPLLYMLVLSFDKLEKWSKEWANDSCHPMEEGELAATIAIAPPHFCPFLDTYFMQDKAKKCKKPSEEPTHNMNDYLSKYPSDVSYKSLLTRATCHHLHMCFSLDFHKEAKGREVEHSILNGVEKRLGLSKRLVASTNGERPPPATQLVTPPHFCSVFDVIFVSM